MAEEKSLRSLSNYLEFGVRLYREDFSQLTAGALIAYLPLAALALYIHPPMEAILKSAENAFELVPRMPSCPKFGGAPEEFLFSIVM